MVPERAGMPPDLVPQILTQLQDSGVATWVDGGWGVDALVGEQTRAHDDLDLALDRDHLAAARSALEALGFQTDPAAEPGLPARLVMTDRSGHRVDLHPLVFDAQGDGWQQLSDSNTAWAAIQRPT